MSMTKINIDRLKKNLLDLAEIGKDEVGGCTRPAYSKEYFEGVELVKGLMEGAGLSVVVDPIGNVLGTKKGKSDKIILIGSHIDTVEHGGIFDGNLGVLGGIEVMKTLDEAGVELDHTVIIANFAEEEGGVVKGLIGSGSFVGDADTIAILPQLEEKLAKYGMTPADALASKCADLENIDTYLELHIEQGGVLEKTGTDIGVVNSIVGEDRFLLTIYGQANHAGTTPMAYRDDALLKAAKLMIALNEECPKIDDTMVCTVGWITALPGEQNIIPGEVQMTVEIRSVNDDSIKALTQYMKDWLGDEPYDLKLTMTQNPTRMSQACMDAVAASADELGLSKRVMPSGAGHDAMMIANTIANSGMIFVPSIGGVSHCPEEWTEWSDVENGTNVLLGALLKLDKK